VLTEFTSVEFSSQEKQNKKKENVTDFNKSSVHLPRPSQITLESDKRTRPERKKLKKKNREKGTKNKKIVPGKIERMDIKRPISP
jgi:hypothetical protein